MKYRLHVVKKFLSKLDNIHSGGCGISALAVYLYLKKHDVLPRYFRIVALHSYDVDDLNINTKFVLGNSLTASPAMHVAFIVNNVCQDVEKVIDLSIYSSIIIIPDHKVDQFFKTSLACHNWNPMFDRDKMVPKIEKKLKINLTEYL